MTAEAGEGPAGCANLSECEIAREVLVPQRLLAKERRVHLAEELPEGVSGVWGQPDQVMQVLSTLLSNAIRATPPGGEVRLKVEEADGAVTFSVSDNAPPVLGHSAPLPEAASGPARVGLRHCQAVAEALGGSAQYEPTESGNRYWFSLPARGRGR